MKKLMMLGLFAAVLSVFVFASGNRENPGNGKGRGPGGASGQNAGASRGSPEFSASSGLFKAEALRLPLQEISAGEKEGLLLMREEEKLARDVYLYLGEKYNARTFLNIAESEQTHMDYVEVLLTKYGIDDPIKDDARGVFTNTELASLYKDLIAKGDVSAAEAYKVGAAIEDLDIYDIDRLIAESDNQDIRILYQNLNKGSRNHMRAFTRQLDREKVIYETKYISADLYKKILESKQESGGLITDPDFVF